MIEIKEKLTRESYYEAMYIASNYFKLRKKPNKKIHYNSILPTFLVLYIFMILLWTIEYSIKGEISHVSKYNIPIFLILLIFFILFLYFININFKKSLNKKMSVIIDKYRNNAKSR